MPEIWLPYGGDEVVINVKAENLSQVIDKPDKQLDDEELMSRLTRVEYSDLVILDGGRLSKKLFGILQKNWENQAKKPRVIEVRSFISDLNKNEAESEHLLVDGSMVKIPSFLFKGKPLVISSFHYNPIFGFFGPHILLTAVPGLINDAMKRWDRRLSPGGDPDTGWFAMRLAKSIPDSKVIAYIKSTGGINELRYGDMETTFLYMKDYLRNKRSAEVQQSRLVIIGAGGDINDNTLASSLLSVANNVNAISDDAEIIVVAECIEGLGSAYLRRIVDGAQLNRDPSAWEEILLTELSSKGRLHLVSTLPKSIVERKLKMKAYSSLREAFESAQQAHGWRFKANIITDSSNFLTIRSEPKKE